jgi:hypothetical protein
MASTHMQCAHDAIQVTAAPKPKAAPAVKPETAAKRGTAASKAPIKRKPRAPAKLAAVALDDEDVTEAASPLVAPQVARSPTLHAPLKSKLEKAAGLKVRPAMC